MAVKEFSAIVVLLIPFSVLFFDGAEGVEWMGAIRLIASQLWANKASRMKEVASILMVYQIF
jgi:hypothetical protein